MKRFSLYPKVILSLTVLVSIAATGCKFMRRSSSLRGFAAPELDDAKTIPWDRLIHSSGQPTIMSVVFSYEEFYGKTVNGENEATDQARKFISVLEGRGLGLRRVNLPALNGADGNPLPLSDLVQGHIDPDDQIYAAAYEGTAGPRKTNLHINIYLLRTINPTPDIALTPSAQNLIGTVFTSSDIVVFNGHIWEMPDSPQMVNTAGIVSAIEEARNNSPGQTANFGLVYMNVCDSELIEKQLLDALGKDNHMILSNQFENSYGNHARQTESLLLDALYQRPLAVVMLHLMTDLEMKLQQNQPSVLDGLDVDGLSSNEAATASQTAKDVIREYINDNPAVQPSGGGQRAKPINPEANVVVLRDADYDGNGVLTHPFGGS